VSEQGVCCSTPDFAVASQCIQGQKVCDSDELLLLLSSSSVVIIYSYSILHYLLASHWTQSPEVTTVVFAGGGGRGTCAGHQWFGLRPSVLGQDRSIYRRRRITCRYRSHDQNCNFQKLKMADGRHFENSIISISRLWVIRFWSNLVGRCRFPFRGWTFNKKLKYCKFKMAERTPYWKSFLAISRHLRKIPWPWNRG